MRTLLKRAEKTLAATVPPSLFFAAQDRIRPLLDRRLDPSGRKVRRLRNAYEIEWRDGTRFAFPHPLRYCRYMYPSGLQHILDEMLDKYQDGPARIKSGDVVFEVGANVGEFTRAALDKGARVFAAEPDPYAFRCLRRNAPAANLVQCAIGHEDGQITFNLATSGADSSIVNKSGKAITVGMKTIASWMEACGIEHVDFLKVEAEGFEPEVIEGAPLDRISNIAIDCGPERDGKPTFDLCEALLGDKFKLWRKGWVLLGVRN